MSSVFINVPATGSAAWKSPVANAGALPTSGNRDGDARVTLNDQSIYVWKDSTSSWLQAATPAATSAITALNTDVSATGPGAVVATIQPNVVSNSKLAQMPTLTIKGNNSGSTANAADLTTSQVKTMLDLAGTNSGDVTLAAVGAVPNANGASLASQVLTLQPANASFPGVLTAADWSTFNGKQNALGFTPENVANKVTTVVTPNNTDYPTTDATYNLILSLLASNPLTLQQVTDAGATTTNQLTIRGVVTGAMGLDLHSATSLDNAWARFVVTPGTEEAIILAGDITGLRSLGLPNGNGTFALAVNSTSADTSGNISVDLQSVTDQGSSTTNSITANSFTAHSFSQFESGSTTNPAIILYRDNMAALKWAELNPQNLTGTHVHNLPDGDGTYALSVNGTAAGTDGNITLSLPFVPTTRTISTTAPITGGGALSADLTLAMAAATNSVDGYLTAADHTTFAAKQPAGNYITALTGDGTASGPGSAALTLATVNSNVGSFTNASVTVNAKGLVTAASSGAAPEVPLTFSTGLTRSGNTITDNLATGVAGGQSVIGGTASGNNLTISSTSNATKGKVILGSLSAYDEVNDRLGLGSTSPSNQLYIKADALGVTQVTTAGITLENTTAAALGAQQISPAIYFNGSGWKSGAPAASQSSSGRIYLSPAQGASSVAGSLFFQISDAGGTYNTRMQVSNTATTFTTASNIDYTFGSTGLISGGYNFVLSNTGTLSSSGMVYSTSSSSNNDTVNNKTFHTFNGGFSPASGTVANTFMGLNPIINWGGTPGAGSYSALKINVTETAIPTGSNFLIEAGTGGGTFTQLFGVSNKGKISVPATITAGGTTGAQTIHKPAGSVNFAAAATTLVVTNNLVTTSSIVQVQVEGTDATFTSARVTLASGSFTITANAAATAETKVNFMVFN